jgi:hypothetical protein
MWVVIVGSATITTRVRSSPSPAIAAAASGEQAIEQVCIGEGADRRHEKIRAALQNALAMRPHRLVSGAFGHGVELVREEAIGLMGQQSFPAWPLHQDRDQLDIIELCRLDVLADGAVADQAELEGHESRLATQPVQAMS